MAVSSNIVLRDALRELGRRLPPGWCVGTGVGSTPTIVDISGADQRVGQLAAVVRARLDPKGVPALIDGFASVRQTATPLLVSPYLSESTRARLRAGDVSYIDLTGNVRVVVALPGLFIETQGASEDPNRAERPVRTLRGAKAGRVARTLIELKVPPGVRELAALAKVDAGYVSRVLSFLDSEALIVRKQRGRIETVDWEGLLRRWANDAPYHQRGKVYPYLEPRGKDALLSRLAELDEQYAITGSHVANALAPVAPLRLGIMWMRDVVVAASKVELVPTEAGMNWLIVEPFDDLVFEGAAQRDGVWYTAVAQAAADLLTAPGRGPQEADALIEWMKKNEDKWRR